MKTNILFAFMIFSLVNCKSSGSKINLLNNSQKKSNEIISNQRLSPIKSQILFDTIISYISDVGVKSNSGREPIYIISFQYYKGSKILIISGKMALPVFLKEPMNEDLELKGICFIDKKPVLVYDKITGLGYDFYDPSELNKDTITYFREKYGEIDLRDNIGYSKWVYKITSKGELKLKEKTKTIEMK